VIGRSSPNEHYPFPTKLTSQVLDKYDYATLSMGLPSLPCTYKNQQVEVPDLCCDKRSKSFPRGELAKIMSHAIMNIQKLSARVTMILRGVDMAERWDKVFQQWHPPIDPKSNQAYRLP